jgi:hypothetical protein
VVTQAGAAACTYTLSATGTSVVATGGTGSVGVTAGAGCTWTVSSYASWLTITAGASVTGTGNGTATFTAAANGTAAARSAILTIAGNTFTVMQGAGGIPNPPANLRVVIGK